MILLILQQNGILGWKKMDNKFIIFSCGYNCEKYIEYHIHSINSQSYKNYHHIIVDDASTDKTFDQAMPHMEEKRSVFFNKNNQKWIPNALKYLDAYIDDGEEIIVLVDLDDCLYHSDVLSLLNNVYNKKDCWMTYSLFVDSNSYISSWIPRYTEEDYLMRNYRNHIWSFTHLRTFKAFLWTELDKNDLKGPDGQYAKYSYDRFVLIPMLEMSSPNKIQFINNVMYYYNNANPLQVEKNHRQEQENLAHYVDQKIRYRRLKR